MLVAVCQALVGEGVLGAWPAWVWFAVMATGNHFWLDCLAGIAVALLAMAIVYRSDPSAALRRSSGAADRRRPHRPDAAAYRPRR